MNSQIIRNDYFHLFTLLEVISFTDIIKGLKQSTDPAIEKPYIPGIRIATKLENSSNHSSHAYIHPAKYYLNKFADCKEMF